MLKKIVVLGIGVILLLGCQKATEKKYERAVPVNVLVIKTDSIRALAEVSGNLEAVNDAVVISKVSEELKEIRKPVGSPVKAGEVIVKLDDAMLLQAKKQAQAALSSARARFQNVQQDFLRYQKLYQQKAISEQQWQKMKSTMEEVKAGLAQAEAAAAQAAEQYQNSQIKAPFAGLVGSIYFDVGQLVPAGQPVVKIINPELMKAKLYLPDLYLHRIQIGQKVIAEFPSLKNKTFEGKIVKVDPAIDPMSRTFTAEALFNNNEHLLTSGLYGLFRIILETHRQAIVVPDNALLAQTTVTVNPETGKPTAHRRYFIFVIKEGQANFQQVERGLSSGDRVEITQGLHLGDSVVVVGQRLLKDGQKVTVVEAY